MFLTGLARVARDAGITVREVPGWKTRTAHKGGMNKVHGVIWHHTATAASAVKSKNNPTLNYMVNGLGYPLANYGLAWDGSLDVIAAGTGAHAGVGSYRGIPNNDGNRHLIGVEVEGTIGLEWSPAQLETAARLGAQLNKDFGADLLHIAHYEWAPGRKTDPTGIPGRMPALRAAIKRGSWAATLNPAASKPTPAKDWFDMATEADLQAAFLNAQITVQRSGKPATITVRQALQNSDSSANAIYGTGLQNAGKIAALENTVEQLATGTGVAIDYEKVKAASKAGTQEAIAAGIEVEGTVELKQKEN